MGVAMLTAMAAVRGALALFCSGRGGWRGGLPLFRLSLRFGLVQATRALLSATARLGGPLLQRLPLFQRDDLVTVDLDRLLADLHDD